MRAFLVTMELGSVSAAARGPSTAGVFEFLVDGTLWLVSHVAGHGWSAPWQASIDSINDTEPWWTRTAPNARYGRGQSRTELGRDGGRSGRG